MLLVVFLDFAIMLANITYLCALSALGGIFLGFQIIFLGYVVDKTAETKPPHLCREPGCGGLVHNSAALRWRVRAPHGRQLPVMDEEVSKRRMGIASR